MSELGQCECGLYAETCETCMEKKIKDAYISGYETGHNDTVESSYGNSEDLAEDYLKEL